jgi:hypothetical protein
LDFKPAQQRAFFSPAPDSHAPPSAAPPRGQYWHDRHLPNCRGGAVPTEQLGDYEIDYSGVRMTDVDGWAAFVTVYGPSANPMHRNSIVPAQRVAVEHVFATEAQAEAEARKAAVAMVEEKTITPPPITPTA